MSGRPENRGIPGTCARSSPGHASEPAARRCPVARDARSGPIRDRLGLQAGRPARRRLEAALLAGKDACRHEEAGFQPASNGGILAACPCIAEVPPGAEAGTPQLTARRFCIG